MANIKVPAETVVFEMTDKGVEIVESRMEVANMDDEAPAVCDLCAASLGKRKDIKHIESPEAISLAVKNGYKPAIMVQKTRDELNSVEDDPEIIERIMAMTFRSWVDMVHKSETPWALCDACFEELKGYKDGKK
jgi:hypothetical protein